MCIRDSKNSVGMPDVLRAPVVKRGGTPDILELTADPTFAVITVFFVQKSAVPLERFIRPYAEEAYGFFVSVGYFIPSAKLLCQLLLRHPVAISCHRIIFQINDIFFVWHIPHPKLFFCIIPWIPEHFIAA